MEDILTQAVFDQGIWVIMFTFLLLYIIKNTEKREAKYQDLLENITSKYDILEEVREHVKSIKDTLDKNNVL